MALIFGLVFAPLLHLLCDKSMSLFLWWLPLFAVLISADNYGKKGGTEQTKRIPQINAALFCQKRVKPVAANDTEGMKMSNDCGIISRNSRCLIWYLCSECDIDF